MLTPPIHPFSTWFQGILEIVPEVGYVPHRHAPIISCLFLRTVRLREAVGEYHASHILQQMGWPRPDSVRVIENPGAFLCQLPYVSRSPASAEYVAPLAALFYGISSVHRTQLLF